MENEKIEKEIEEIQTTFNEDGMDVLVEDGSVENEYKDDETE